MLAAEGAIGELHIVGGFDVVVGEPKGFVVPGVVGVFEAGAEIAEFGLWTGLFEHAADELVEAFVVEDDGDGDGEGQFGLPTILASAVPCFQIRPQTVGFVLDLGRRGDLEPHLFLVGRLHFFPLHLLH
jgi:hypothetical protein